MSANIPEQQSPDPSVTALETHFGLEPGSFKKAIPGEDGYTPTLCPRNIYGVDETGKRVVTGTSAQAGWEIRGSVNKGGTDFMYLADPETGASKLVAKGVLDAFVEEALAGKHGVIDRALPPKSETPVAPEVAITPETGRTPLKTEFVDDAGKAAVKKSGIVTPPERSSQQPPASPDSQPTPGRPSPEEVVAFLKVKEGDSGLSSTPEQEQSNAAVDRLKAESQSIAGDIIDTIKQQPNVLQALMATGPSSELEALSKIFESTDVTASAVQEAYSRLSGGNGSQLTPSSFDRLRTSLAGYNRQLRTMSTELSMTKPESPDANTAREVRYSVNHIAELIASVDAMGQAAVNIQGSARRYLDGGSPRELAGDIDAIRQNLQMMLQGNRVFTSLFNSVDQAQRRLQTAMQ